LRGPWDAGHVACVTLRCAKSDGFQFRKIVLKYLHITRRGGRREGSDPCERTGELKGGEEGLVREIVGSGDTKGGSV
jgi:hypothetical protein